MIKTLDEIVKVEGMPNLEKEMVLLETYYNEDEIKEEDMDILLAVADDTGLIRIENNQIFFEEFYYEFVNRKTFFYVLFAIDQKFRFVG